jgi:hypothetical protein
MDLIGLDMTAPFVPEKVIKIFGRRFLETIPEVLLTEP